MAVVVVTDSSSRLQPEELKRWGIRQVPLHVLLDGKDMRDGVDEVPHDIHERHATTAGATPAELADAYREALADSGGDGVVAVHISAALSSTFSSAVQAAREFGPAVRRGEFAVGGDGRRVRRAGRGAVRRHPVRTWTPSRPPHARPCRAAMRSSSCIAWTICGAAAGSAPPRPGWVPRCRSSRCCAWTWTAGWCWLSGSAPSTKAHAAMVDQVAEVVGDRTRRHRGAPRRQP